MSASDSMKMRLQLRKELNRDLLNTRWGQVKRQREEERERVGKEIQNSAITIDDILPPSPNETVTITRYGDDGLGSRTEEEVPLIKLYNNLKKQFEITHQNERLHRFSSPR